MGRSNRLDGTLKPGKGGNLVSVVLNSGIVLSATATGIADGTAIGLGIRPGRITIAAFEDTKWRSARMRGWRCGLCIRRWRVLPPTKQRRAPKWPRCVWNWRVSCARIIRSTTVFWIWRPKRCRASSSWVTAPGRSMAAISVTSPPVRSPGSTHPPASARRDVGSPRHWVPNLASRIDPPWR